MCKIITSIICNSGWCLIVITGKDGFLLTMCYGCGPHVSPSKFTVHTYDMLILESTCAFFLHINLRLHYACSYLFHNEWISCITMIMATL